MGRHTQTARGGSWLAEATPGRVFELTRKTYSGRNVLALVIRDPLGPDSCPWRGNFLVEVGAGGCVADDARGRARRPVQMIRADEFRSALVVGRRPELERFDADDVRLIAYGIKLSFGGRMIGRRYGGMIMPSLPGVTWTAFWRSGDPFALADDASDRRRAAEALRGAWHQEVSSDLDWRGDRHRRHHGFVTAQADPARLSEIRTALRRLGMSHEASARVAARDEGDHYAITAGDPPDCPLFSRLRFTTRIAKPGSGLPSHGSAWSIHSAA